ncbi:Hypothetical protein KVN_LOCUS46 [uncultured virus]|nr:Hypothetical protein KVN_LOCUS46 [uncultured virus]
MDKRKILEQEIKFISLINKCGNPVLLNELDKNYFTQEFVINNAKILEFNTLNSCDYCGTGNRTECYFTIDNKYYGYAYYWSGCLTYSPKNIYYVTDNKKSFDYNDETININKFINIEFPNNDKFNNIKKFVKKIKEFDDDKCINTKIQLKKIIKKFIEENESDSLELDNPNIKFFSDESNLSEQECSYNNLDKLANKIKKLKFEQIIEIKKILKNN